MPTFEVTAPNGKTYEVTGPEGSTKEQALAQVQAQYPAAQFQEDGPTMKAVDGFVNNFAPLQAMKQDSLPAMLSRFMFGKTDAEKLKEKEEYRGDPTLVSISKQIGELEDRGMQDSDEYRALEQKFNETADLLEQQTVSEFDLSLLADAWAQDKGAVAATFANALAADPYLMLTPLGWEKAAASSVFTAARLGKTAQTAARVAKGSAGAFALGAAVQAPISVAMQYDDEGDVDWTRVAKESAFTGSFSAVAGAAMAGGKALRSSFKNVADNAAEQEAISTVGAASTLAAAPTTRFGDWLTDLSSSVKQFTKEVIDFAAAKSISYIDELADAAPSINRIRNTLEYREFQKVAQGPSFYERIHVENGRFYGQFHDSLDQLTTPFLGRLRRADNDALVKGLRGGVTEEKFVPAVKGVRALLDDLHAYATEAGLDVGYIKNYFPRKYSTKILKTKKGEQGLTDLLMRYGLDAEESDNVIRTLTNEDGFFIGRPAHPRWTENGSFVPDEVYKARLNLHGTAKNKHLETSRTLARIPDEELAPFLDNNVYDVLGAYITSVVRRSEFARAWGPNEGKLNSLLRKGRTEAIAAGRPPLPAEFDRIYNLVDATQRKFNPIQTKVLREANKKMASYQVLRTLSLATISSLSEPWVILSRGRLDATLAAVPATMGHVVSGAIRTVYKKFPKAEATRALENVGIGLDHALGERLTAAYGGFDTKATQAFFKATFLHQWTRFNRVLGYQSGQRMIVYNLQDLSRGGLSKSKADQRLWELAELGIRVDDGVEWVRRGMPKDDEFVEALKYGALRFTNEVVMDPRPTVRPMWHSNPTFHLLAQLKGFPTTFGNTVMKRWFHTTFQRGARQGAHNLVKNSTTGMLMVMTAMWGNEMREAIKYGPGGNPRFRNQDWYTRLARAVDRAGFTGAFQSAIDAMYAHRFGSSALAAAMGPAASQADQFLKAWGELSKGQTGPMKNEIVKAIPIVNSNQQSKEAAREIVDEVID